MVMDFVIGDRAFKSIRCTVEYDLG